MSQQINLNITPKVVEKVVHIMQYMFIQTQIDICLFFKVLQCCY